MVGSPGRTRSSWLRELMSSLVKTLRRWYWTVRGLMNSRVPISGFESPSRASRAIWASWAVSSSRVSTRALADGLARGQQLARGALGERLDAHRRRTSRGRCAAARARRRGGSRVAAIRRRADGRGRAPRGRGYGRGARSTRGRGSSAASPSLEQGADAGFDPQRPLGGRHTRALGQPLECGRDERDVTGPGRRLGQLGHDKGPDPTGSRSKACQAASRAASWRPRPL